MRTTPTTTGRSTFGRSTATCVSPVLGSSASSRVRPPRYSRNVSVSRRGRFAIVASIVSFVFVATVAANPGSPFSPALPVAARPSGPFRWLSGVVGLDAVHGNAFAAVGVVAVALAAAAFAFVLYETWRGGIPSRTVLWLTVAYHVALLFIPLLFSRDVYSYAYYGRIEAVYHSNPYI